MADNREVENAAPRQEQQYQPILELRKQLEEGPKYVLLQEGITTYKMVLGNENWPGSDTNNVMADDNDDTLEPETSEEHDLNLPTQPRTNCIYVQSTLGHGGFGFVYKAQLKRGEQMKSLCLKLKLAVWRVLTLLLIQQMLTLEQYFHYTRCYKEKQRAANTTVLS